jgi:hypothetical protein
MATSSCETNVTDSLSKKPGGSLDHPAMLVFHSVRLNPAEAAGRGWGVSAIAKVGGGGGGGAAAATTRRTLHPVCRRSSGRRDARDTRDHPCKDNNAEFHS